MGCRNEYAGQCCVCGQEVPAKGGDITKVTLHMRRKKFPNAVRGRMWLTKHFKCPFPQKESEFYWMKQEVNDEHTLTNN